MMSEQYHLNQLIKKAGLFGTNHARKFFAWTNKPKQLKSLNRYIKEKAKAQKAWPSSGRIDDLPKRLGQRLYNEAMREQAKQYIDMHGISHKKLKAGFFNPFGGTYMPSKDKSLNSKTASLLKRKETVMTTPKIAHYIASNDLNNRQETHDLLNDAGMIQKAAALEGIPMSDWEAIQYAQMQKQAGISRWIQQAGKGFGNVMQKGRKTISKFNPVKAVKNTASKFNPATAVKNTAYQSGQSAVRGSEEALRDALLRFKTDLASTIKANKGKIIGGGLGTLAAGGTGLYFLDKIRNRALAKEIAKQLQERE